MVGKPFVLAVLGMVLSQAAVMGQVVPEMKTEQYALRMNPATGDLISFSIFGRDMIFNSGKPRALFSLRLRDDAGAATDLNALEASSIRVEQKQAEKDNLLLVHYDSLRGLPVSAVVTVRCPASCAMTYWHIAVRNETGQRLEHVDFPTVVVPDRLVG